MHPPSATRFNFTPKKGVRFGRFSAPQMSGDRQNQPIKIGLPSYRKLSRWNSTYWVKGGQGRSCNIGDSKNHLKYYSVAYRMATSGTQLNQSCVKLSKLGSVRFQFRLIMPPHLFVPLQLSKWSIGKHILKWFILLFSILCLFINKSIWYFKIL